MGFQQEKNKVTSKEKYRKLNEILIFIHSFEVLFFLSTKPMVWNPAFFRETLSFFEYCPAKRPPEKGQYPKVMKVLRKKGNSIQNMVWSLVDYRLVSNRKYLEIIGNWWAISMISIVYFLWVGEKITVTFL